MKINKILAAGVAATLAVTSLSAVVSAEAKTQTFDMASSYADLKFSDVKIAYLGDNTYIEADGGSDTLTKAYVLAAVTAGTAPNEAAAYAAVYTAVQAAAAKAYVGDGTTAGIVDITGAAIANATTIATANTKVSALMADLKTLKDAAATAGTDSATSTKTGADAYNALAALSNQYTKIASGLSDLKTVVDAYTVDANVTAGDVAAIDAQITTDLALVNAAITELEAALDKASVALYGEDLITTDGGIVVPATSIQDAQGYTWNIDKVVLKVKGTRKAAGAAAADEYVFERTVKSYNANGTVATKGDNYYLFFVQDKTNKAGFANLNVYQKITDFDVLVTYSCSTIGTKAEVDARKDRAATALRNATQIKYVNRTDVENLVPSAAGYDTTLNAMVVTGSDNMTVNYDANLKKLYTTLDASIPSSASISATQDKYELKPFLPRTTEDAVIKRDDVYPLSVVGSWYGTTSIGSWTGASSTLNPAATAKQTFYDATGLGTVPYRFEGLASQVADFFNKQNNGKIVFKFTTAATSDSWKTGGVPATEVGLRNALAGTSMALFFNYDTSTGSLVSLGVVDSDAATITFDMASVLDDMGGLTKGNLENIFYGLNTGLDYNAAGLVWHQTDDYAYAYKGYVVDTVTLEYDDAAATVDATKDDDAAVVVADDDDDVVVADDDDDDVFADDDVIADDDDDDDDDAGIIEDDDDDDTDVNNDVDYVDGDDDANPGTGVGLAVIPAIVAAAAAIVSKKRK
jgi:hypothetical protein